MKKLELYKKYLDSKRPLDRTIVKKIEDDLRLNFIYHSNAIEGNTLTIKETQVILEYGVTVKGKPLKEHLEVKGQEFALDFLIKEIGYESPISIKMIREFHQLILGGIDPTNAGKFKTYQNFISGSKTKTSNPIFVEEDLVNLIDEYNNSKDETITKIAKFHANFEKIHPFIDGNGRTGRLLMNYELIREGYPICIIENDDRLQYYNALEKAQAEGDYSEIIRFIEHYLEKTFERYFDCIDSDWKNKINQNISQHAISF